uniref:Uncharacterized protein n=1 Tax=Arundo donax TaxID=35708 RepID=A0A0A9GB96_ARUDO
MQKVLLLLSPSRTTVQIFLKKHHQLAHSFLKSRIVKLVQL